MIRHILLLLTMLGLGSFVGLGQSPEFNNQDELYLRFHSNPPNDTNQYTGFFEAVKFWKMNPGGSLDIASPTSIYARAWYDKDGNRFTDSMFRVAFNGTPLKARTAPSGTEYVFKRDPEPFEDWLSWYAHLDETQFPKSFAFDTLSGAYRDSFGISFPIPFKLQLSRSIRMGGNDLLVEAEPAIGGAPAPDHGDIRFYPNTTMSGSNVFISGTHIANPGSISMNFPAGDWITGSPGWGVGVHEGFTGIGVCNDKVVNILEKKFLFRACSITVQPVSITVTRQP